ncbi:MAG: hypothetical protein ACRDLF_03940 [Solirubrobacteraceae bacterium]
MSTLAYADEARRIRELAPLTERDIARGTGAARSTVGAWLQRTRAPSGVRADRVVELAALVDQLARVLAPEAIPVWLNRPMPALGHRRPLDVLAAGDYEQLAALADELAYPTLT